MHALQLPYVNKQTTFSDAQLALANEHISYHHHGAEGYITLSRKVDGKLNTRAFSLINIFDAIPHWMGEDVYYSQNTFQKGQRRVEFVQELRALYTDLDCHGKDREFLIGKMERELFGKTVPHPNLVVDSGRGLYVIWLLEPANRWQLPLWQAVENYLVEQFVDYDVDTHAKDAARIFRFAGSINSKNGAVVTVLRHYHDYRYELEQLAERFLPEIKPRKERVVKSRSSKNNGPQDNSSPRSKDGAKVARLYNLHTLNFDRLNDLNTLVSLRNGRMMHMREISCFLYRYWSCLYCGDVDRALEATLEFNQEFSDPLSETEVINSTKSSEKAYLKYEDKEITSMMKEMGFPAAGYNFTNLKLIELLKITPEEEREMKTIIGPNEKKRRKALANHKKRRELGVIEREKYLQEQAQKSEEMCRKIKVMMLETPNATQKQIAELLGVDRSYVSKLLKKQG